jgi:hypothetical protein
MRAASQPGRSTISYHNSMLQTARPRRLGFSGTFGRDAANDRDRRLRPSRTGLRVRLRAQRADSVTPFPSCCCRRPPPAGSTAIRSKTCFSRATTWPRSHGASSTSSREPLGGRWIAPRPRPSAGGAQTLAAVPLSAPTGELSYRLATEVPENRYPLLPKQTGLRAIEYQLGEARLGPNPTPTPLGSGLGGSIPQSIQEEELYRPRLRVRRLARRVRRSDGSVGVWLGRRTSPGRGTSGSGLHFDSADGGVAGDRHA